MSAHMPNEPVFVVVNEHTLGYLWYWDNFTWVAILSASVLRGASRRDGSFPLSIFDVTKIATKEDFDTFRVSSEGYKLYEKI